MELSGTEAITVELDGAVSLSDARCRVPAPLRPAVGEDGGVPVRLLLFRMRGLRVLRSPALLPTFDYDEALWLLAAELDGMPSWFAIKCDLQSAAVSAAGALVVRYPVRRAVIDVRDDGESVAFDVRTREAGHVAVRATPEAHSPPPVPPRRVLAQSLDVLYEIPWREEPAPHRKVAACSIAAAGLDVRTLGDSIRWSSTGLVHRGRTHTCGTARRFPS